MSEESEASTLWNGFVQDSASGVLIVDRQVAKDCSAACTVLLDELMAIRRSAHTLTTEDAFGDLQSGKDLRDKFNNKAIGDTDSLTSVMESHIDVVTLMKTVSENSIKSYELQDAENAHSIAGTDK
ncbi:hypothetical protein [Rhodococcus sp. IEGM 1379]|uniref:hypothetical protein n=1 Tax=Rhodococcus sp. IEGM 1379 TaxID=3047086 RepID=UPI0024B736BC|nr:hypothetical protein [Rhodococcus sp. IEGM 1379]MDI9917009.1 hypothetical protein [Rhodococcus sp. IEGM 1379]